VEIEDFCILSQASCYYFYLYHENSYKIISNFYIFLLQSLIKSVINSMYCNTLKQKLRPRRAVP